MNSRLQCCMIQVPYRYRCHMPSQNPGENPAPIQLSIYSGIPCPSMDTVYTPVRVSVDGIVALAWVEALGCGYYVYVSGI